MYKPVSYATTALVSLSSSLFLILIGGTLLYRGQQYCYIFMEPWIVGVGCFMSLCSVCGIFCASRGHSYRFWAHMGLNLLCTIGFSWLLSGYVQVSWTHIVGFEWWTGNPTRGASDWGDVVACFESTSFCNRARYDFAGCCQQPRSCTFENRSEDCSKWNASSLTCYNCNTCMSSTFEKLRSDTRLVISQFITVWVLMIGALFAQFFLAWRDRRVTRVLPADERTWVRKVEMLEGVDDRKG